MQYLLIFSITLFLLMACTDSKKNEEKVDPLESAFIAECKSEASKQGYTLNIREVRYAEIIGDAFGEKDTIFSCKKLNENGERSLTGSRIDLRIQQKL